MKQSMKKGYEQGYETRVWNKGMKRIRVASIAQPSLGEAAGSARSNENDSAGHSAVVPRG